MVKIVKKLETNLTQNRTVVRKTRKNFHKPITDVPTLRYYLINGEKRLVWVFKENDNVRIVIADSRIPIREQAKMMFRDGYYQKLVERTSEVERRRIPKRVKKMFAGMSQDDIEWAMAVDFEPDYEFPEEIRLTHGDNSSVPSYKLGDMELFGHSHPGDDGIYAMPSARDLSLTNYKKPELVAWTNPKTGKTVWICAISDKEPYKSSSEQAEREAQLKNAWDETRKKMLAEHPNSSGYQDYMTGETGNDVYIESTRWFREEFTRRVNELGYDFEIIDPSETPVVISRDKRNDMEKKPGPKSPSEFNPKAVQAIFKHWSRSIKDGRNAAKIACLIEIETYARKTGNNKILKIAEGDGTNLGEQTTAELNERLFRVKESIDTNPRVKKVSREAWDDLSIGDALAVDVDNVKSVEKHIKKIRKNPRYPAHNQPQPGDSVQIVPSEFEKPVTFKGQQYEVERVNYAAGKDTLAVGFKARIPKDKQNAKSGNQASGKDIKNVRRLIKWKRIKKDKELRESLENVIKDAKSD